MEKEEKAIAFVRLTITGQQQSESTANQYRAIAEYAKKHCVKIQKTFESTDSASTKATLDTMLAYCEANPYIHYILVSDTSRLFRNFTEYGCYKAAFAKHGVEMRNACENDTRFDEPMARFTEAMMSAIGNLESSRRSEMINQKMLDRSKLGYSVHRPPLGYSTTKTSGLFRINRQGRALRVVLKKLVDGKIDIKAAAACLTFIFSSVDTKLRPWCMAKAKQLALNPYYAGFISCQGNLYEGLHEPILTPEEHQRLVRLLG